MRHLRPLLKWSAVAFALGAALWLAILFWGQQVRQAFTHDDTLLYWIFLPMTVVVIGTFQQFFVRSKSTGFATVQQAPSANTPPNISQTAEKPITLPVLGAWCMTSAGLDSMHFWEALVEKRNRPTPDPVLVDDQGFPLLTGRVNRLDTTSSENSTIKTIPEEHTRMAPGSAEWRDAVMRTCALLESLVDHIQQNWPLVLPNASAQDLQEGSQNSRYALPPEGAIPPLSSPEKSLFLQVTLLLPVDFHPSEQQHLLACLSKKLAAFPFSDKEIRLDLVPAQNDGTILALADEFSRHADRNRYAEALLILACDSLLCASTIKSLQSENRLFTARTPDGVMPGEAAFGFLCANDRALQWAISPPLCHLAGIARTERDTSAKMPEKPSSACLTDTITHALKAAGITGSMIGTVACDADHRVIHALECMGTMMDVTPHLDVIRHRLAVNEAYGYLGTASVPGALIAAIMQTRDAEHPVLLFNVSHEVDRVAAVLISADRTATCPPSYIQADNGLRDNLS